MRRAAFAALAAVVMVAACSDDSSKRRLSKTEDAGDKLGQRVFQPSPGVVRALPPYSIRPASVGGYQLGAELREILTMLPHGPRVELFEIENVVGYSLVRAEDDRILIGIRNGRVAYVAVLDDEIAKVEGGLGVGSSAASWIERLGPVSPVPAGARDPRVVSVEQLANARLIVDDGQVVSVVVGPAPAGSGLPGSEEDPSDGDEDDTAPATPPVAAAPAVVSDQPCSRPGELLADAVVPASRASSPDVVGYGCVVSSSPELIVRDGDRLQVLSGEPANLRVVGSVDMADLTFAGVIDIDGDLRHELVGVAQRRSRNQLEVRLAVWRGEGGRLVPLVDQTVYQLNSATAAWTGAKLRDVDFLLQVEPAMGALRVSGLYLHRSAGVVRHVAPLTVRTVSVRPRRRVIAPMGEPERAVQGGKPSADAGPRGRQPGGARPTRADASP